MPKDVEEVFECVGPVDDEGMKKGPIDDGSVVERPLEATDQSLIVEGVEDVDRLCEYDVALKLSSTRSGSPRVTPIAANSEG